jgi:hypothetical protein
MIRVNIDKAKGIAHDIRRAKRADEFAPYDRVIAAQIPGTDEAAAESARQDIRDKYAVMQTAIDAAQTPEEIKGALNVA